MFPNLEGVAYNSPEVFSALNRRVVYNETVQELDSLLAEALLEQPLLISSEGLSFQPWNPQPFPGLFKIDRLKPVPDVILFLREPTDWLQSIYGLAVKKGRYMTPGQFLGWDGSAFSGLPPEGSCDRKRRCAVLNLDFASMVSKLIEVVGRERLHVFHFEHFRNDPEQVLAQLIELLDVPLKAPFDLAPVNSSPQSIIMGTLVKRSMASYHIAPRLSRPIQSRLIGWSGRFVRWWTRISTPRLDLQGDNRIFSEELEQALQWQFAEHNHRLRDVLGGKLPKAYDYRKAI